MRTTVAAATYLLVLFAAVTSACRAQRRDAPRGEPVVVWKQIGTWSGRGNIQTETFTSDTAGFRVRWETKNEAAGGGGRLRVVFRSGDSGREILEALDVRGVGHDVEEVAAERPRWYYLTIESANVDWRVSVDERIDAERVTK